jgi:hypothetical protein
VIAARAPLLLAQSDSARAAVAALPVLPATSSHLAVSALDARELRATLLGAVGSLDTAPPDPAVHVHTPHCWHGAEPPGAVFPEGERYDGDW